jgi:hypothetical protein
VTDYIESDWPQYSLALADRVMKDQLYVKQDGFWLPPGEEGHWFQTLKALVETSKNVRVLKPGHHEWVRV